jgi:hypothetical protein
MRIEGKCHCGNIRYTLVAEVGDGSLVSRYRFGTQTAEGINPSSLARAAANFDGEGTGERLDRRRQIGFRRCEFPSSS